MIYSQLRETLKVLSSQIEPPEDLKKLRPESGHYLTGLNKRVDDSQGIVGKVVAVFPQIPELAPYNEGFVRSSPTSSGTIKWDTIAHWLLAQTRLIGAESAVQGLQEFVSTESAVMYEVVALWGLHPKSAIQLTEDIELVPINMLVPSDRRDWWTGLDPNITGVRMNFVAPRSSAALRRQFAHKDILVRERKVSAIENAISSISGPLTLASLKTAFEKAAPAMLEEFKDRIEEGHFDTEESRKMREIVKCLCLLKNTAVCELANWYESPLSTPMIGGVLGSGGQAVEHIFQMEIQPEEYDEISAKSLVEDFLAMSETDRGKLDIPLTRLNTALREPLSEDKALDLGIALESLLGPGHEEISYKIRLRGTLLVGGNEEDRRHTFQHLNKLYGLRSTAAHGDKLDPSVKVGGNQVTTDAFLKECCSIVSKMIREIIKSGFVSDWEGRLLGW
jgi:Apea-like HEPN